MSDKIVHPSDSRTDISRTGQTESSDKGGGETLKEKIGHAFNKIKENAAEERQLDDMTDKQFIGPDDIPDEFGGPVA